VGAALIAPSSAAAEASPNKSAIAASAATTGTSATAPFGAQTGARTLTDALTNEVSAVSGVFVAPRPTISGTRAVGKTLTAVASWTPTPDTFAIRWKRGGTPIYGAIHQTYKLTRSDAGKLLSVTVKGSKTGYTTVTKTSASVRIQKVLTATPIPKISGTAAIGRTLKAVPGIWKPAVVTLHYAWIIDGVIVGTRSSFMIRAHIAGVGSPSGKYIAVYVTGSKSGYTSITRMSLTKRIQ
jgi:hypothetical protein